MHSKESIKGNKPVDFAPAPFMPHLLAVGSTVDRGKVCNRLPPKSTQLLAQTQFGDKVGVSLGVSGLEVI